MNAARLTFISTASSSAFLSPGTAAYIIPSSSPRTRWCAPHIQSRRRCQTVACHESAPYSSADRPSRDKEKSDSSTKPGTARSAVSRTLIGRALVEVLSLVVGALLLLVVVAWRASQVVSLAVWRALLWLANLRRLGKWGCTKLVETMKRLPSASALRAARDAFFMILTRQEPKAAFAREEELSSARPDDMDVVRDVVATDQTSFSEGDGSPASAIVPKRRLVLVRHAKTVWDRNNEVADHERVLSLQGRKEAQLIGAELAARLWFPDKVLCSNAVRTVQTLNLLNISEQDALSDTFCTESLYYAVTGEEMAVAVDEALGTSGFVDHSTLMVVCHNPGCEELVEQLTGHRPQMGTGCAVLMEYDEGSEMEDTNSTFCLATYQRKWDLVEVLRPAELLATSSSSAE